MHTAKLVWITPDAQDLVAKIARVSNPSNENNKETAPRLLRYLIKHKHWSPFEMVSMCVEITTTRAISPQILRHRSFSFQEFSQRYAIATEVDMPMLRRQDTQNRQNSIDDLTFTERSAFYDRIDRHFDEGMQLYDDMLKAGIAKECARAVLPSNTATRMYMTGTIRSWLHYCDLRCANGTQAEHQQIANSIKDLLEEQVPDIYDAMFC